MDIQKRNGLRYKFFGTNSQSNMDKEGDLKSTASYTVTKS